MAKSKKSTHQHESHKDVALRLKRAHGHLAKVINMLESEEGCLQVTQQLHAVTKALLEAKKALVHDHIEHCLTENDSDAQTKSNIKEFKEITKYL